MERDSNTTFHYSYYNSSEFWRYQKNGFVLHITTCIIISIGLPLTLVTIFALYSLVRKDHVAPIYVINLLITDFIQLCCMIQFEALTDRSESFYLMAVEGDIYTCLLFTSVGFMVCVSLERYLVIAHPLWYRFRRNIKITVAVCVVVWLIPPIYYFTVVPWLSFAVAHIVISVFLTIPFPLFIFFLAGTLRALSTSVSVSSEEKHRIVGIQVLVLFIYMFLFMPSIIFFYLQQENVFNYSFIALSYMFAKLSPLADVALYIFIRKDSVGERLAASCCCIMEDSDNHVSAVNGDDI